MGFAQVNIELPDKFYDKLNEMEMAPLFVAQEVPDRDIPKEMKIYQENTGRKTVKGTKKLLGFMRAKKILLYTTLIKWYLEHGLRLTAGHYVIEYEPGKPFSLFQEEVANARRETDKYNLKKTAGLCCKIKRK